MKLRKSLTGKSVAAGMLGLGAGGALLAIAVTAAPILAPAAIGQVPADHPGAGVYQKACAVCHDNPGATRAAALPAIKAMPAARLQDVIAPTGIMGPMSASLSAQEKTDLIAWLTAGQATAPAQWTDALMCAPGKRAVSASASVVSQGFGVDAKQTRSLSAAQAGLSKSQLSNLEVAWAIAYPGQGQGSGASVLSDGTVFTTGGQRLIAIDAASGCLKWAYTANSRNTPAIGEINGRKVVAIAIARDIHVVDAATGSLVWKASGQPVDGTGGQIRGGVIFAKDKVIVPISASGVAAAMNERFECCTGHGSVVALNAADGSHAWEYHTMPEATYNGQVNSLGVKLRGPSGAPIWSVPVYDAKRNLVIVTTGENTSHPGTDTSDAVIAINADTGKVTWQFQAMAADIWNMSCSVETGRNGPNCPVLFGGDGRDFDFGAGAVLASANGKDIVLAGQKSGHAWALDADTGKVLWSDRVGEGTALGGVHWGIAVFDGKLVLPINDPGLGGASPKLKPGVFTFDIATGRPGWSYAATPNCEGARATAVSGCMSRFGFSAAPVVVDGAIVGATLGGEVIILDGADGRVINRIDTVGPIPTLNKDVAGKGGSIDAHAISAGAGMIFINSGYGQFGQTGGNALIAYKPKQ